MLVFITFGNGLGSLIWHLINVWLFFVLIKTVMIVPAFYIAGQRERTLLAFFTAAIWACYPTHSEAISWISARGDLIATAFYFATLILFAKHLIGKQNIPTALVALPLVLGLLTKELSVSLPFVLFSLYFFSCKPPASASWLKSTKLALLQTLPYFLLLLVYLIGRGSALGDPVGVYAGSIGVSLNKSLIDRWLVSQTLFKIFHPFNDQYIPADSPLRITLRLLWGMCGVMTVIWARLGGAIAGKYRLMLFAFAWLFFTLATNIQICNFTEAMVGGRMAYLPTAPIVLVIVLAVYPMGAWVLPDNKVLTFKLAGFLTLIALIVVVAITSSINNRAWLKFR
jgi:hypothetical protein